MNREDIIRMAREAGFTEDMISLGEALVWEAEPKNLERFAALAAEWGANQEREACAKVCEGMARPVGDEMMTFAQWIVSSCADAIRNRGK